MSRRFTQAEKGKALVPPPEPPRLGRVKVPAFDNSVLVKRHALTLIGKVTNPKIQRMWSLLPFFTEHWKTSAPALGTDLGHGKFQYQFATEEDMQLVLDNRPYHFAHWMLILQRWEQTVSTTFPSQIPFSIKVQDVPVHLWSEAMLRSIGEDLGTFETWEITKAHAKMRVQVNGLLPILKTYNLEFANGDEVLASLVYEKLEKHCTKCGMLDHEEVECHDLLVEPLASQLPPPPLRREVPSARGSHDSSRTLTKSQRNEPRRDDTWGRNARMTTSSRNYSYYGNNLQRNIWPNDSRNSNTSGERGRRSTYKSGFQPNSIRYESGRQSVPRWVETGRRVATSALADSTSRFRSSEVRTESARDRRSGERRSEERVTKQNMAQGKSPAGSSHSRSSHRSGHRPSQETEFPARALLEARGEVRDVMTQYTICADPTESAARKERLRQAEERGEIEQTAVQMVRHSQRVQNQIPERVEEQNLEPLMHERIPASQRLGPILTDIPIEEESVRVPAKKRLGRPPNKKKTLPSSPPMPKKRRMTQLAGSPKRRLIMGSTSRRAPKKPTSSKGQPSGSIIPAISKQRMDFQDPSTRLP
ncbi:unnamed protein product [Microthlaspi erraticum]|uniref:DUF4283 domain-containing protein n=1 Tax=Microthlaspi erraticum TaxID=1685480 RepID=A0A6D2JVS5_9BRAS|nr:unnamed protein product [Microthlaspi erraticum]